MQWKDAVKQMIKAYWEEDIFDETETFKKAKYNKKYFKSMEEEFFPSQQKAEKKAKKGTD